MSSKAETTELVNSSQTEVKILLDEEKRGEEQFGVEVVPALFLIGSDGIIAFSDSGERTYAVREQQLSEFINLGGLSHE